MRAIRSWSFRRWMLVASLLSLALNLVVLKFTASINVWGDAYYYHHGAQLIADGKGWIDPYSYISTRQIVQAADHPPVHLLWLAMFSFVGLDSVGAHQFATILVGVAAIPMFGLVGRRLGGHTAGVVSALVASVYAGLWTWNKMILSEPSAIIGLLLVLLVALRAADEMRNGSVRSKTLVFMGLAGGFATLTRAELGLTSALVIVIVLFNRSIITSTKRILVAAGVFALTLAPWVSFNLSRFDTPVYLSTGFEITIAATNCPQTYSGNLKGYWLQSCAIDYSNQVVAENPTADRGEIMRGIGDLATQYIKDNKVQFAKMTVFRVGRVLGVYRPLQQMNLDSFPEGRDKYAIYLAWSSYAGLLPFAVAGGRLLRHRKTDLLAILATVAVALFTCAITFGNTRYRITAEPALVLLASLGLVAAARGVWRLWNTPDAA